MKNKELADKDVFTLRQDSRKNIITMIKHFMQKCSVNYALVRHAICIDPRVMAGYPEKAQEKMKKGPYGYTTQALSSVASNSGHDIKPVATAQQGMYSNAGMPAPAQHHQSMGGPIASPQPMIQQGQQISRNPITMQTAAAYYPRNSVPPRAMQSMARNPLGAVVNQPGQQPSSQYGPMPTMVPLQPNFTSFPPTMVNPQFPQM
ncbi:hypothetical protein AVEN_61147-1, partial [Araneus ventricosus]